MLTRPVFKPHYQVKIFPGEGILFLTEHRQHTMLHGALYERLAHLLSKKQYTSDQIAASLESEFAPAEVYYGLMQLHDQGYIMERDESTILSEQAFWTQLGHSSTKTKHRLNIHKVGNLPVDSLYSSLQSSDLEVVEKGEIDLHIVIADSYYSSELAELQKKFRIVNQPWLLLKPTGCEAWIGPLFMPNRRGCYSCLLKRLLANQPMDRFLLTKEKSLSFGKGYLPSSIGLIYHYAALEIERFFKGDRTLQGKMLSIDLAKRTNQLHALIPVHQCECQGDKSPAPPLFHSPSAMKAMKRDGGYRVVTPEETIRKYEHLVSPIGIVSELKSKHSDPIFVYTAGYNRSGPLMDILSFKKHFRSSAAGKGLTKVQAKASALCEALERYSGIYQGHEGKLRASFSELGSRAISPSTYLLFSESQYKDAKSWTKKGRFSRVPLPFDEKAKIEWTPVFSLTHQCEKYLPTQLLYYEYRDPENKEAGSFCFGDSNGCASGNTLEEAILQGFFELVEHDAVSMWWYNRLLRPRVDIESFDYPPFTALLQAYQEKNREVWGLDLTNDFNIPTFAVISRIKNSQERIIFGLGCHPNFLIALSRALTEMAQMFAFADQSTLNLQDVDPETAQWIANVTIDSQPYLWGNPKIVKQKKDYVEESPLNLGKWIDFCRLLCEQKGMEFLVLDQTRPETNIPVCKVIVPGMRHTWPRFAPGRLYDVPVQMGWFPAPLLESELNPIPFFF